MNPRQLRGLRIQSVFLLIALVVQYALGMYVNLFISFPDTTANEGQLWEFAWAQPALATHIVLAMLILLGAIVQCIRASRSHNGTWIWSSLIGLLAVLAAGASGASFIPSQTDLYSYSMSIAFLIALVAYAWALFSVQLEKPLIS
jgi:hypothetical protein